jgi:hypothetical protein
LLTGKLRRRRRQSGYPPACQRGARPLAFGSRLGGAAPATQQEDDDAGALGGKLQPASRHHRQPPDFGDYRGQPRFRTGMQRFLDGPQHLVAAPRRHEHDPGRVQPVRQQPRPVQIGPFQAPQHEPRT